MNRLFRWASAFSIVALLLSCSGCAAKKTTFLDCNGEPFATLTDYGISGIESTMEGGEAYAEIVYQEAAAILAAQNGWELTEAQQHLVDDGYTIETHLDPSIYDAVATAYSETSQFEEVDVGCAVTNHSGLLLAAFSGGDEEYNFSFTPIQPYSTIKPLSVYGQAIEDRILQWSDLYADQPVKTIKNEQGEMVPWPQNSTNTYQEQPVDIPFAVRKSLNTVAVRCLLDVGVEKSVEFLKENFSLPLATEEYLMEQSGAEEIWGNIALGYLREGITAVDLAGYYQSFANGGYYTAPRAVRSIQKWSKMHYRFQLERKQVWSGSTAALMNKLLQEVVSPDGSGANAALEGIEVAGKTGTGEQGNWFVGITPEYSCAVWHGNQLEQNIAENLFAEIFKQIPNKIHRFSENAEIYQSVYCCESGLLQVETCPETLMGWYRRGEEPGVCQTH